jgi:YD repeat-containing protein
MTLYDAEFTTVRDQAGKERRSMVDGLGRLARVDEPDGSGNLGSKSAPVQPTFYSYDALGNLTQVSQGVQRRSFVYSSLSRLISATNPESGTTTYQYDNNGNLSSKTDARGITTQNRSPVSCREYFTRAARREASDFAERARELANYSFQCQAFKWSQG